MSIFIISGDFSFNANDVKKMEITKAGVNQYQLIVYLISSRTPSEDIYIHFDNKEAAIKELQRITNFLN